MSCPEYGESNCRLINRGGDTWAECVCGAVWRVS